jgi:membrane protein
VRGFAVRRIFNVLRFTWQEYERDYARYFAAAMVYYALVSLVPLILLILGALGLLLRQSELAAAAEAQVLQTVEANLGAPMRVALGNVLQTLERGSTIAVIVSLIGLMLTGAKLFHHLRMTFRAIWHAPALVSGPPRIALRATLLESLFAFLLLLVTSGLLLIALLLMAALQWLHARSWSVPFLRQPVAWLLATAGPLIFTPLTFALLFKALPPVRLTWRQVWPASVLCALAWLVGAEILGAYGSYAGKTLGAYGAIGGLLILMLWISVTSQMLFFGAELCKVANERKRGEG